MLISSLFLIGLHLQNFTPLHSTVKNLIRMMILGLFVSSFSWLFILQTEYLLMQAWMKWMRMPLKMPIKSGMNIGKAPH